MFCRAEWKQGRLRGCVVAKGVRAIAIVLGFVAGMPTPASAWGSEGHRLVAGVAQGQLTAAARAEIDRLLALEPGSTLASISTWADEVRRQRSPRRSRRSGGAEERRGSAPHGAKSRGRCSGLWPASEASASARSHRDRAAARDGSAEVPAQDEERDASSSAVPARRPTADRLHRLTVPPAANEPADFRRQTAVGPSRLQLLKDCQA